MAFALAIGYIVELAQIGCPKIDKPELVLHKNNIVWLNIQMVNAQLV